MAIDRARILRAQTLVQQDERGYFTSSRFDRLLSLSKLTINMQGAGVDPKVSKAAERLRFIDQDFRNLLTLHDKADWITQHESSGALDEARASLYVAADIDMFHVEFRSLFDYLAALVHVIARAPAEITANNFGTLMGLLRAPDKPRVRPSLGNDLAMLLDGCDWFEKLQNVRDSGVHQGGFTLVYPAAAPATAPLFQSYEGSIGGAMVDLQEVMFNENIVNFGLYSALHISYLLVLLDDIAGIAQQRLPLAQVPTEPRSYHLAWPKVIARWADLTHDFLTNPAAIPFRPLTAERGVT